MANVDISYLIIPLRLKIGDTDPAAYRYTDDWLKTSLVLAVKNLQRFWNFRYLVDTDETIYRNPNTEFILPDTYGVIQQSDEYVIIVMSAYITLEGSLQDSAWNVSSWSDAEIRYTNIDSGRIREGILKALASELESLIKSPSKRLAWTQKSSLPGFKNNEYERQSEF
jgi:hypothetical protein